MEDNSNKKTEAIERLKEIAREVGYSVREDRETIELLKEMAQEPGVTISGDWVAVPGRIYLEREESLPVIGIQIEEDLTASVYIYIRSTSWEFPGERTDIHDCFSALLAAFIRAFADGMASCSLWDVPNEFSRIETELYARYITLEQVSTSFTVKDAQGIDSIKRLLVVFIDLFLCFFGRCCGWSVDEEGKIHQDYSYVKAESWEQEISKYLEEPADSDKTQSNIRLSPNWAYYRNIRLGISICHSPGLSHLISIISKQGDTKVVDGINGKIFLSGSLNNVILHRNIRLARKVLSKLNNNESTKEITLIPSENFFIAASDDHFLIVKRDCGKKKFEEERERIRRRHDTEARLLFPISQLIWKESIDDEEFELLIRDLVSREKGVSWVRKVSASNERDGGRDLIADWSTPPLPGQTLEENTSPYTIRKVLIQCKAFRGSVGKSKVQDIRDTLEHHNAQGYFLAVSSQLTTTLTDYLEKMRLDGTYWVDWWTRSEIEEKLKGYPELVSKYPSIVSLKQ